MRRSMELGNEDQAFNIMFVNDWGSHLDDLLPSGAIYMAFPWFKPDCTKLENLSAPNAVRCTDFNHSLPFYDALVGYYTLVGSAYGNADSYQSLYGARLCRPAAWFTFDLEVEGLVALNITLVQAETQAACWDLLRAGDVDVVTYDALPAQ
jgi:polar amino acid transport system substrate-binding protein